MEVIILKFTFVVRRHLGNYILPPGNADNAAGFLDGSEDSTVRQPGEFPVGKMFDVVGGNRWFDWRPCVFARIATDTLKLMPPYCKRWRDGLYNPSRLLNQ
ncbi:hypothetical protein [Methylomicrobium lacus]|uniref:hypothetical protein n=1 Tax=Methylomicrobium lacus TaxID=136992 RepID=UPI0035A83FA4